MKIVQVIASVAEEAAGPTYSAIRLSESLAARGVSVNLMSLGGPARCQQGTLRRSEFQQDAATLPVLRQLRISDALNAALHEEAGSATIVHNHGLWLMPNIYAGRAAAKARVPLVISPRGMFSPEALAYSRWRKRLFWVLLQRSSVMSAKCLHATSEKESADIRAQGVRAPVCIIPNGIDVLSAPASGKPQTERVLLFLGRLHPVKRVENLLRSWLAVKDRFPGWRLEIAGPSEPSYVAMLKKLANGAERTTFSGPLFGEAKQAAYRRASLYVLPSASENFGITIAESLAAGTPVITTRGTPWSALADEKAGWWIDHGEAALTSALTEALAKEPAALYAMGERGTRWMERSFSWDSVARRMHAVYHWLANGGPPPPDVDQ